MRLILAAAVAVGSVFLTAQAPVIPSKTQIAVAGFANGDYLKANDALASEAFEPNGGTRNAMAFALWKQFNPFLTNELDVQAGGRSGRWSEAEAAWAQRISASEPRDAIQEIVSRARKTNIVILNEAHSSPRDRAFALRVARALRPLGYRTLAAETFDNNAPATGPSAVERLKQDGVVRLSTGVYTKDPVFARFVQEALALGYEPVAYEQTKAQSRPTDGIAEREQVQAANLMQRVFSARPNEKVLIFVGWGHVAEKPLRHTEMMALRLKRMSGVDPLTIDQTSVTEASAIAAYTAGSARIGKNPVVFFEGKNPLLIGRISGVDLQVIHPRRSYIAGRPAWLVALGGKRLPIPRRLVPDSRRRLIQVFAANAPRDAVPLDQVLVDGSKPLPAMLVPAEPVRFEVQQ